MQAHYPNGKECRPEDEGTAAARGPRGSDQNPSAFKGKDFHRAPGYLQPTGIDGPRTHGIAGKPSISTAMDKQ